MSGVIWTSVLMFVLTIVFLVVLSSFASRVPGVRIGEALTSLGLVSEQQ